jgi:hypothetical protein
MPTEAERQGYVASNDATLLCTDMPHEKFSYVFVFKQSQYILAHVTARR